MGLILDTTLLIAHERRRFDLVSFLVERGAEPVAISIITVSELLHGLHRAKDPRVKAERAGFIAGIRQNYTVIPFGDVQAEQHSRLWAELEAKGSLIGAHDLQIAATALSLGFSLATMNIAEFSRVPDLHLIEVRN